MAKDIEYSRVSDLARALGRIVTVFDLETTTFRGRANFAITEVACFCALPDGRALSFGSLINPEQRIEPDVSRLTGITAAMVAGKETWGAKYAALFDTVAREHVAAGFNNATFDCPAVLDMNRRYGVDTGEFAAVLDARQLHFKLSGAATRKGTLPEIAAQYGVTPSGTLHRASADVALTAALLDALLGRHGIEGVIAAMNLRTHKGKRAAPVSTAADVVALIKARGLRTVSEVAALTGLPSSKVSFMLSDAVDHGLVSPMHFADPVVLTWLRDALFEIAGDVALDGPLKPVFAALEERKPDGMALDYLQLRAGLADAGVRWAALKAA